MDDDQSGRPGDPSNEPSGRKKRSASRYQLGEPILFVADTEMIHRLGVPERAAYAALHMLDRDKHRGFPQKQKLWGNRRYWPAVKQWFDQHYGVARAKV